MDIGITGDIFLYNNQSEMRELCVMLGDLNPALRWASGPKIAEQTPESLFVTECPGIIHVGWPPHDRSLDRAYWRDDSYDELYNLYRHELSIEPRVFSIDDIRSMYNDDPSPSGYDETPMSASELFGMAVG